MVSKSETTAVWQLPEEVAQQQQRLNRPVRALVAAAELMLAAAGVLLGVWCWHHGMVQFDYPFADGRPPLTSSRLLGNWAGAGIGMCSLAALLVLDALRQLLLASRARQRRKDAKLLAALRAAEAEERALKTQGTEPAIG